TPRNKKSMGEVVRYRDPSECLDELCIFDGIYIRIGRIGYRCAEKAGCKRRIVHHLRMVIPQRNRGEAGEKIEEFTPVFRIVDGYAATTLHIEGHIVSIGKNVIG